MNEENTSLIEDVEALLIKYRKLKAEYSILNEKLESSFRLLNDQDRVAVSHFSQANCKVTPAF